MKTHARVTHLFVMGVFLSMAAGCAFGNRHATLVYPPEEGTMDPGPGVAEASPAPAVTGEPIILLPFADERSQKKFIGEVRNGWGMHTADVVTEDNIANWVTEAIKIELGKAGYNVTKVEDLSSPSSSRVVAGEVLTVYCTALWSYEGEVSFYARVEEDGKEVFRRRYTGKGSAGLNWTAAARSYGNSLSLALADAIGSFVADLNSIKAVK